MFSAFQMTYSNYFYSLFQMNLWILYFVLFRICYILLGIIIAGLQNENRHKNILENDMGWVMGGLACIN